MAIFFFFFSFCSALAAAAGVVTASPASAPKLSCRAGLFDGGSKNGRCAPQLNECVAYSTQCTPSFTKSGTAHTLVVLFLSSLLSAPLNGSASSVWAVFAGAPHPAPQRTPVGAGAPILREGEGHLYTYVAAPPSKSSPRARARPCARWPAPFAHLPGCANTSPRGRNDRGWRFLAALDCYTTQFGTTDAAALLLCAADARICSSA